MTDGVDLQQCLDIIPSALSSFFPDLKDEQMFRDLNAYQPRREPPPERKYKQLTPKQERILLMAIAFNLVMALFAPFCGSTLLDGVVSLFRLL
ncbi:hypothetical protein ACQZ4Y_21240 [Rhizobium sp. L80/93]|nr:MULTISPECIES: hypothetical protein [unclassified Rhizobium]QXZ98138.1 hypothetical protein J5289_22845 [Rhizobium sp. B230/85]QYA03701.1 hypothetical protein J5278_23165 [Rhizobium sp. B21/90]